MPLGQDEFDDMNSEMNDTMEYDGLSSGSVKLEANGNGVVVESEEVRRHRRLVANSNERRRMQGINNGFEALRGFLACSEDQKLSKAAILQKTVAYIQQLLTEKSELVMRNAQLEKVVGGGKPEENPVFSREVFAVSTTDHAVPIIKQEPGSGNRRKRKASTAQLESNDDEGVASLYSEHSGSGEDLQSEVAELREETKRLRLTLENERLVRRNLEAQIRNLQLQNQSLSESARFAQDQYAGKISNNVGATTPGVIIHDETPRCRTVSRNNLESIVEAIRRLEGDHLFADEDDRSQMTPSPGSPSAAVEEVEISATDDVYITP